VIANIPHVDGAMVATPQTLLTLEESTVTGSWFKGNRKRQSDVVVGQHATKGRRNFQWLPWLPGALTHVLVGAVDVLTGPMSGCDLVLFNRHGAMHAGHLGTNIGAPAANNAVKTTWNNLAANHPGRIIGRFNPLRDWNGPYPTQRAGKESNAPKIFGLLTTRATFYVLFTYAQDEAPNQLRIAAVQKIPGANPATAPLALEAVV
jgi:hypothetical protein